MADEKESLKEVNDKKSQEEFQQQKQEDEPKKIIEKEIVYVKEQEKPKKKKEPNYLLRFLVSLILGIVITFGIISFVTKLECKMTFTSIEYSTTYTDIYFNVESINTTTYQVEDFVLYISGSPQHADCFIVDNYSKDEITISIDSIITVRFYHTKLTIDQPIKLFVKGKETKINKTKLIY